MSTYNSYKATTHTTPTADDYVATVTKRLWWSRVITTIWGIALIAAIVSVMMANPDIDASYAYQLSRAMDTHIANREQALQRISRVAKAYSDLASSKDKASINIVTSTYRDRDYRILVSAKDETVTYTQTFDDGSGNYDATATYNDRVSISDGVKLYNEFQAKKINWIAFVALVITAIGFITSIRASKRKNRR